MAPVGVHAAREHLVIANRLPEEHVSIERDVGLSAADATENVDAVSAERPGQLEGELRYYRRPKHYVEIVRHGRHFFRGHGPSLNVLSPLFLYQLSLCIVGIPDLQDASLRDCEPQRASAEKADGTGAYNEGGPAPALCTSAVTMFGVRALPEDSLLNHVHLHEGFFGCAEKFGQAGDGFELLVQANKISGLIQHVLGEEAAASVDAWCDVSAREAHIGFVVPAAATLIAGESNRHGNDVARLQILKLLANLLDIEFHDALLIPAESDCFHGVRSVAAEGCTLERF